MLPPTLRGRGFALVLAALSLAAPLSAQTPTPLLDRLDFGRPDSEKAHGLRSDPTAGLPPAGLGAHGLPHRQVAGPAAEGGATRSLTFTLACDPARQNYATVKLWGNDRQRGLLFLLAAPGGRMEDENRLDFNNEGDNQRPAFAGRFYYATLPIPRDLTTGKKQVSLTIDALETHGGYGADAKSLPVGYATRPIYSVFSHVDPFFQPPAADLVGKPPEREVTPLEPLTAADADALILASRRKIFAPGGDIDRLLARQVLPTTKGAPRETWGFDAGKPAAEMARENPSPDRWRNEVSRKRGAGYTAFPDEMLTALYLGYLTPPLRKIDGTPVPGLDRWHDPDLLDRMVHLFDGASYLQVDDGGFAWNDCREWPGVTSSPREGGDRPGTRERFAEWGISLEGVNTQSLGIAILRLLSDPDAQAVKRFRARLEEPMDSDLQGTMLRRADVYSRMLFKHLQYVRRVAGGTPAQNQFMVTGMIWAQVALEKLHALYPNPSFPPLPPSLALNSVEQALGLAPTTLLRADQSDNFAQSALGLGQEGGGTYDGGYDGRYGQSNPWLVPFIAQAVAQSPALNAPGSPEKNRVARVMAMARATVAAYNQFISAGDEMLDEKANRTRLILSQEDFITTRNSYNPNVNGFNVNAQYIASDPTQAIREPLALRSAYLETQFGRSPGGQGMFLRHALEYENTIRLLAGKSPASLPALPGEPGQPDFVFADVTGSALALVNQGERLYLNLNWRRRPLEVNHVARLHHTTPGIDRVAMIAMPHDDATVQSDGNLSGDFDQPWVVRYGRYLIAFNRGREPFPLKLPPGRGTARDLVSKTTHALGAQVVIPGGQAAVMDLAPTPTSNAPAAPAPAVAPLPIKADAPVLRGTSTGLRAVLPAIPGVTFTWTATRGPALAGTPTFQPNGSAAAQNSRVTFSKAGAYELTVTAKDAQGRIRHGSVIVDVQQVPTRLDAGPKEITLTGGKLNLQGGTLERYGGTDPLMAFSAVVLDQFNDPLSRLPEITWKLEGGPGTLTAKRDGRYVVPPDRTGETKIVASFGALRDTCRVTVAKPAPGVGSVGLLFEK